MMIRIAAKAFRNFIVDSSLASVSLTAEDKLAPRDQALHKRLEGALKSARDRYHVASGDALATIRNTRASNNVEIM